MSGTIKFLNSNTALGNRVAVGVSSIVGPTGPKGDFGGPQGLQGLVGSGGGGGGSQGAQGYQGLAGVTGSQGYQGFQGLFGATGTQGLQGLAGAIGATGPSNPGVQGYQGLIGATGAGFQGLAGAIGPTGPSNPGVQGLMGVTGSFGLQGVQGIAGVAIGSLANVKLSYTRTTDSPAFSNAGNKLYAFSGATGGINNTPASNITFNPALGSFTVSQQGDYYFDARLIIKGNNNPDFITTDVYVNTGTVYNYTHVAYGIVSPVAFPIGLYLPLNIGDTVNIACYTTGTVGSITIKAGTTMNMFRITNGPTGSFGATGPIGPTGPAGIGGGGSSQWISSTGGIIYYSSGSIGIGKANPTGSLDIVGTVSITGPLNLTGNMNMIGNMNMTGSLNIAGNIVYTTTGSLINPTFQNYQETVNLGTSSTSSYVINCNTGNNFSVTLATATTAFTFINVPATGTLENINLFLTQDNSGGRFATFPASVSWGNPSTPVLSTTGNATDIIALTTFSGGSKWFGFLAGKGF